jgi:hypothetical protein
LPNPVEQQKERLQEKLWTEAREWPLSSNWPLLQGRSVELGKSVPRKTLCGISRAYFKVSDPGMPKRFLKEGTKD